MEPLSGFVVLGGNSDMKLPIRGKLHIEGLGEAIVVEGMRQELHSVSKLDEEGYDTLFSNGRAYIFSRANHKVIRTGTMRRGLYFIDSTVDTDRSIEEIMKLP